MGGITNEREAWRVSLHGGHSGDYCDHATGALRAMLEAAVDAGMSVFGVTEHAPRLEPRFLYSEERARGWDVAKLQADFARYQVEVSALAGEFADRLMVLRGFEAEVVPTRDYARQMRAYRDAALPDGRPVFDYFVGSVHYVEEIQIDGRPENYRRAADALGGVEQLAVRYYETVAEMVATLRPEVVGHFDLIKKNVRAAGFDPALLETDRARAAADLALDAVRAHDAILDLNTAGWRKGLGEPYPAPWLIAKAHARGIPFCFGDDSHAPAQVGAGLDEARAYLLTLGVPAITVLTCDGDSLARQVVPLAP